MYVARSKPPKPLLSRLAKSGGNEKTATKGVVCHQEKVLFGT